MKLAEHLPKELINHAIFPSASQEEHWEKIVQAGHNRQLFEQVFISAQSILSEEVPTLPASLFMDFVRNGNRSRYEKCYFQRRRQLSLLVLAECGERKGRFLDKIIDYLWDIAAEPTWCLPAHIRGHHDALPNESVPTVDLFAAETAMILAQVLKLLEAQLSQQSQCLIEVLHNKILERIIIPLELTPFPFWWSEGRGNWTPWCCANCLGAARAVLDSEPIRLRSLVLRLCQFVDNYLEKYPLDGACDEGPDYWAVSPGVLTVFLEQLISLGAQANSVYRDSRLAPMAEFIVDADLGGGYFASFSDSNGKTLPPLQFCQRLGERLNSQKLLSFTAQHRHRLINNPELEETLFRMPLFNFLAWIFWLPEETKAAAPATMTVAYYPVTELLFAKATGIAFAAKGGHNSENHNHNDLGQFILVLDEKPLIIDLGAPEYRQETFSANRYLSIITNSFGHNVPAFSGQGQCPGQEFSTRAVEFQRQGDFLRFSLDLADAYPAELELQYCRRTLLLDLTKRILTVEDDWKSTRPLSMHLPLFSAGKVKSTDSNTFLLQNESAETLLTLQSQDISCQHADFVPEDTAVQERWQSSGLSKIEFSLKEARTGNLRWEIRPVKKNET